MAQERELFELTLSGGASERAFRRQRADIEALPWAAALPEGLSSEQVVAARQGWTLAALQEYQAAAAHAAVLTALLRARAPLDFSAQLAGFPVDELQHAGLCVRVANYLGGGAPVSIDSSRVFAGAEPGARSPLVEATILVARLFGVGESWSHGFLDALRRKARPPLLRAVWTILVRDEASHARFGWAFLRWARAELEADDWREVGVEVRAHVQALLGNWHAAKLSAENFSDVSVLGADGYAEYVAMAEKALHSKVIGPFARLGLDVNPKSVCR